MAAVRKIIHIDADAFFASVEMRDNPELRDKAIAVGGSAQGRGVIATANYVARRFGVRSAMASSHALSLCPQLLIVKPRFDVYRQVSKQFHCIFADYSDLIEPLSLDEAFLDVSASTACGGSATLMAQEICHRISDELQLTVSAGVAPNKFLAKVASDWNKPNGVFTVSPAQVADFVRELPVAKINGVGKVTAAKLLALGVTSCADLQALELADLVQRFGSYGKRLHDVSRGIDDRVVRADRQRKSISVERTYPQDLNSVDEMLEQLDAVLRELEQRFAKIEQCYYPQKRLLKIRFSDFSRTTLEEGLAPGDAWLDSAAYNRMLQAAWPRGAQPVRLLGAGLRLRPRQQEASEQIPLFAAEAEGE